MSYCRWSSCNFTSDVYCFANVSGKWTTMIATNRIVGEVPDAGFSRFYKGEITAEECAALHKAQSEWLGKAKHEPLGMPYDGKIIDDDGPEEMIQTLVMLRGLGYRVPDHAIEALEEEANASSPSPTPAAP